MAQRGRKSKGELTTVENIVVMPRPQPPSELVGEQVDEWHDIVNRLPADWFPRETWPLLVQYCRHAVSARRVAQLITKMEDSDTLDVVDYDRLLKCQERESRMLASLAVRLRIAQSTTYDKSKKKPTALEKPWESA